MLSICTLIVEMVVAYCIKTFIGDNGSLAMSSIFIAVFSVAFLLDVYRSKELNAYSTPITIGYVFRIALLYWDIYGRDIYSLPSSGLDSEGYFANSLSFAAGNSITYGVPFTNVMGYISRIIGSDRLFLQFYIVLFSMITIICVIKTFSYVDSSQQAKKYAILLICLLPNYAIMSAVFLREAFIIMLMTLSLYLFIRWYHERREIDFILSIAFVAFATACHSGCIGVGLGYIAVRMLYDVKHKVYRMETKNIVIGVILFGVFAFLYINYGEELFGKIAGVESISDISDGTSYGGSSYAQYVGDSSSIFNMIIYTPLRFIFFMFSPFPWQWRGLSDIIAFVFSSMFYLWTWIRVIKYFRSGEKANRNLLIALTITVLCVLFIFAWGVANTGTAIRHRDKVISLYIVMWCASYIKPKEKKSLINIKEMAVE